MRPVTSASSTVSASRSSPRTAGSSNSATTPDSTSRTPASASPGTLSTWPTSSARLLGLLHPAQPAPPDRHPVDGAGRWRAAGRLRLRPSCPQPHSALLVRRQQRPAPSQRLRADRGRGWRQSGQRCLRARHRWRHPLREEAARQADSRPVRLGAAGARLHHHRCRELAPLLNAFADTFRRLKFRRGTEPVLEQWEILS